MFYKKVCHHMEVSHTSLNDELYAFLLICLQGKKNAKMRKKSDKYNFVILLKCFH